MRTGDVPDGTADRAAARPRNTIVVLLDSVNRHMVGACGGGEFETPNLHGLARRSLRFDRHHTGSLPCMPARHDILVGALDFLQRPWGSIEVWEQSVVRSLGLAGMHGSAPDDHHPYRLDGGPVGDDNLAGTATEPETVALLRHALEEIEAPAEQFARLGIA